MLRFITGAGSRRWLAETLFTVPELAARGTPVLRAYRGSEGFQWRRGVMAVALFFLRYAAWGLRRASNPAAPEPVYEGRAGEAAGSFEYILNRIPEWAYAVFGRVGARGCLLSDLVRRESAGFSHGQGGLARIALDLTRLAPEAITVRVDGRCETDPAVIDDLVADVARQYDGPTAGPLSDPPGTTPPVVHIPYEPNDHFIGRAEELRRLAEALTPGQPAAAVLSGPGGVGKTQLAARFARAAAAQYTHVLWVRGPDLETLAAEVAGLAEPLGLPAQEATDRAARIAAVLGWLGQQPGWLLVFDAAPGLGGLTGFLPIAASGHILITSRESNWPTIRTVISVGPFDRAAAVRFLTHRVNAIPAGVASDLAAALGDLPLALEQAAVYLLQTGLPPAGYLALVRSRRELWARRRLPYPPAVATTWDLALEAVSRESPAAADLLRLCAHLGDAPVSRPLLVRGRRHLGEPLRAAVEDPHRTDDLLAVLRRYALLETTDAVTVHPLVAAVARDGLPDADRPRWARTALDLVRESFTFRSEDETTWTPSFALLPHALAAVRHAEEAGLATPQEEAPVLLCQAVAADLAGDHAAATTACRWVIEHTRATHSDLCSTATVHLATALDHAGEQEEALGLLDALVAQAPAGRLWWVHYQRGVLLRRLGRTDEARAALDAVVGAPVLDALRTSARHHLGVLDLEAGDLDAAEVAFHRCLAERGDDPRNHRRLYDLRRLAEVAARRDDPAAAGEQLAQAARLARTLHFTRYLGELREDAYRLGLPDPTAG